MAVLRDGAALANDRDDRTETTPQPGAADSGWSVMSVLTYVPQNTFPLRYAVTLGEGSAAARRPSVSFSPVVR